MNSKQLTLLLIRLSLGIIYMTSGLSKLAPEYLGNIIGPVNLEKAYESNSIHILMNITAIIQTLLGSLILSQRYSIIGLIFLLPLSVGILIFTIYAGFGLTPIINLLLLLLLIYLLTQEKKSVKKLMNLKIEGYRVSKSYLRFSQKRLSNSAILFIIITALLTFWKSPLVNFTATISLILFLANLFQRKDYLFADYLLLGLFFIIGFIIINGILLNQIIDKAFYSVFLLIPLGFLIYLASLIYRKLFMTK